MEVTAVTELKPVASTVVRVTLFEDRAEVVRRARVVLRGGREAFVVDGVSALIDDPSLVVRVTHQGIRVLSTRVGRSLAEAPAVGQAELAEAEGSARRAEQLLARTRSALERAEAEQRRSEALESSWAAALARVPRGDAEAGSRWARALATLEAASAAAVERVVDARRQLHEAEREHERSSERWKLAQRRESRRETRVWVEVDAELGDEVTAELSYRVPCAAWRPEHRAVLEGEAVVLTTYATAWQCTGEAWVDVPLVFSTARPARAPSPPLLDDDVLTLRKKTTEERRVVVVEAREQLRATTGAAGERALDELPGVDDGGEPRTYEALRPSSLPSDGGPVRVELAHVTLAASVDRVAMPELGSLVHVRARLVNTSGGPILAGPVTAVRGQALVGKGRVGFVAAGDPLELGFGPDDGLRVRRTQTEKRETRTLGGAQLVTRTVTVFVSNTSGTARTLSVVERYPVSELGDVTITLLEHAGATLDARDGLARYTFDVGPRATHTLSLVYRIEAASKVALRI